MVSWIEEAVSAGARLLTGGTLEGACLRSTVLADVPARARVVWGVKYAIAELLDQRLVVLNP